MASTPSSDPTRSPIAEEPPARRRLLVLGAGRDPCFMLRLARELGIATFAVDGDPDAPGLADRQGGGVFIVQGQARTEVFRYTEEIQATVRFVVESEEGRIGRCGGDPGAGPRDPRASDVARGGIG